ncbi:IS66 family transposase [Citrobacter braakii]
MDNNRCERAIRPVVMGRSNLLLAGLLNKYMALHILPG